MKTRLLGLLAATALSMAGVSAASAADLPVRAAPPAPIIAAPIFTWTGFYVGVNAGYGWSDDDFDAVDFADDEDDGGFVGGAQVGYNWQFGSFVFGAEADVQFADFGREGVFNFVDENNNIFEGEFERSDWFGTARARAGVAFGQALIYATGGFAFADDATGWTAGGGLEYAFTNNLSAKIEGLYVSLENDNEFDFDIEGFDNDIDFGVVRAGLNYRFNTF